MARKKHPVWGVYDLYRTARLNVKYFSAKLHRAEIITFWTDLLLLIAAPGSAIAGLWFWEYPIGNNIWKVLGAIAAFVAILKPLLNLTNKIKVYDELRLGYRALEHDLHEIKELVAHDKKYDTKLQSEFKKALKRKGLLVAREPDSKESKRLKKKCTNEVLSELPSKSFYVPEE